MSEKNTKNTNNNNQQSQFPPFTPEQINILQTDAKLPPISSIPAIQPQQIQSQQMQQQIQSQQMQQPLPSQHAQRGGGLPPHQLTSEQSPIPAPLLQRPPSV